MDEKKIFNQIADLIAENFNIERAKISMETNFTQDLDADSIDLVEFIMQLEDKFDAEIPDADAEKIKTVKVAVNYIKDHE